MGIAVDEEKSRNTASRSDADLNWTRMRQNILRRQSRAMDEQGLDAMISCSPENFALCRRLYRSLAAADPASPRDGDRAGRRLRRARSASTWKRNNDPAAGAGHALARLGGVRRRPMAVLADYLRRTRSRHRHVSALRWTISRRADFAGLQHRYPQRVRRLDERIIARLRQIKTPEEIGSAPALSRIADQAIADSPCGGESRRHGDRHRGRPDPQHLRTRRRELQAADRRHRRAQPVAERRPDSSGGSNTATSAGSRSSR